MVIIIENGQDDTSSNLTQDYLHFTERQYFRERHASNYAPATHEKIVGQTEPFNSRMATDLGEGKF